MRKQQRELIMLVLAGVVVLIAGAFVIRWLAGMMQEGLQVMDKTLTNLTLVIKETTNEINKLNNKKTLTPYEKTALSILQKLRQKLQRDLSELEQLNKNATSDSDKAQKLVSFAKQKAAEMQQFKSNTPMTGDAASFVRDSQIVRNAGFLWVKSEKDAQNEVQKAKSS